MEVVVERGEVYLIELDPTRGSEIRKTRPGVVVSPDEMNRHINTVIVAPMTTKVRAYPSRVALTFHGKRAQVVLDQIRTVDRERFRRRLGRLAGSQMRAVLAVLTEMFSP